MGSQPRCKMIYAALLLLCCMFMQTPRANSDARSSLPKSIGNFRMRSAPIVYTSQTLEQHIDGASQAVQRYLFKNCLYAVYAPGGVGNNVITVDIYTMGSPLDAFGYYSTQLSPGVGSVKLMHYGASAFALSTNVTFWKGDYYVSITVAGQNSPVFHKTMLGLASLISMHLQGSTSEPAMIKMLPAGYLPHTEEFLRRDVAGERFLINGVVARYPAAGEQGQAFVCKYASPSAASSAFRSYISSLSKPFLLAPGSSVKMGRGIGSSSFSVKTRFSGYVQAALKGDYIVGCIRATSAAVALKLVKEALQRA